MAARSLCYHSILLPTSRDFISASSILSPLEFKLIGKQVGQHKFSLAALLADSLIISTLLYRECSYLLRCS